MSKADAKGNYPFALVLMPFSLLLQPRTAWHENCEAETLACISPHLGKRSACLLHAGGSRNTNHGLFSVCHGCARMAPPESAARTATPPSHCFPVRYGAAMERHERQIAPEPVSAHLPPFTVGLTKGAVRHSPRCPSGVLRRTRRKPGTVVAGLPPVPPPGVHKAGGRTAGRQDVDGYPRWLSRRIR